MLLINMYLYFPFLFIFFWSSAFVSGQFIVQSASPFAALTFRFIIVSICFLLISYIFKEKILINLNLIIQASITGILFHGFYLGGVFFSYSVGLTATLSALIVGLQPILTNILSGPILKERVTLVQWVGIFLGFVGALLVLGFDIGNDLPLIGIISSFIALIAITSSTILQKKISNNLPLSVSNLYQAIGGCLFHLLILIFFIDPYINLNTTFLMAMSHQIFLVSFGAFTILMFLIKKNSASKTVSIFFLIPATTAIIAWLFLNETLNNLDIVGFIIATFGVYVATRKN